jgi:integrase
VTAAIASLVAAAPGRAAGTAQAGHVFCGEQPLGEAVARLAGLIDPGFLAEAGWDRASRTLTPAAEHLLLGRPVCAAVGCLTTAKSATRVCRGCVVRLAERGLTEADVALLPPPSGAAWTTPGAGTCLVTGCPRPWTKAARPLCPVHLVQRQQVDTGLEEFLQRPDVLPLPSHGVCSVDACSREVPAAGDTYCGAHVQRWRIARRAAGGDLDVETFQRTEPPVVRDGRVVLLGLDPLVVVQVLFGLQQRTRAGVSTPQAELRGICNDLRRQQVRGLQEYAVPPSRGCAWRGMANSLILHARRGMADPAAEVGKDVWDMGVFGHRGTLSFTGISQRWLRQCVKGWAADDLPNRRGSWGHDKTRHHVNSMVILSDVLRMRPDHGDHPAALGRADIEAFLARAAYLESTAAISTLTRVQTIREVRQVLTGLRQTGSTAPDGPAAGLSDQFTVHRSDVPAEPERPEPGRDLPPEVMRILCAHLPALRSDHVRVGISLAMDTGRRPDDLCALPLDCLGHDTDGKPVLIYDNHKAGRRGRRLPISEATAAVIIAQQERVRARYPQTPLADLKLLPTTRANPLGTRHITVNGLENAHRQWVDALPPLLLTSGGEYAKARIVLYSYRHTYAQRHADAGVGIDVLAQLMDHRALNVTRQYYRVEEKRRRSAVDTVSAMQFDRHGNRIWRDAANLLESAHARYAIGEVSVPYGRCSEPSNVHAGGGACPVRFRCAGCDHFRTDVSYLPDLTAYLDDLLRTRERLTAAIDGVDEWARADALPTQEEITRIRRLINQIKGDITALDDDERSTVENAVTVIRRHRTVALGIPALRAALPRTESLA